MRRTLLLAVGLACAMGTFMNLKSAAVNDPGFVQANPDLFPPRFLSAQFVGTNQYQLLLIVDEPLCTGQPSCVSDATDHFNWQVLDETTFEDLVIDTVSVSGTNVIFTLLAPLNPSLGYRIQVEPVSVIGDLFGNLVSRTEFARTRPTALFQQNVNSYTEVENAEVAPPCNPPGSCPLPPFSHILVGLLSAGGESQGLLRFNSMFGNGFNQVPIGATILSAKLTLQSTVANANGDPVRLHRMLLPWGTTWDPWTAFVSGVQADGIEAHTNVDAVIVSKHLTVPFAAEIDVTQSVRAWADGEPNYGWVLLSTGPDAFQFDSSVIPTTGPQLKVVYLTNKPALTINNDAGNAVIRWDSDSAWELVSSPSSGGPYTPVVGNPSGMFVLPPAARTNPAAFFRIRLRDGMQ